MCKSHVLDLPPSWMYWPLNKKMGAVEITATISTTSKTITRTITIPVVSPVYRGTWRNCSGGYHLNKLTLYNGTSEFYDGASNLPALHCQVYSGSDGFYDLPLMYGWVGSVWTAGQPCPTSAPAPRP